MASAAFLAPVPSPRPGRAGARDDVRHNVRALLSAQQGFNALDQTTRRDLARGLVKIGSAALDHDDMQGTPRPRPVLALAQNAGSEFSGVAVDRVAGTTQAVLNAVSFPRFVTELITGVFKAMNDSNQQQLTAFVELIRNVAQTTEGFADSNVGVGGARQWLAEHFPASYEVQGGDDSDGLPEDLSGLSPDERRERQAEIEAERAASTRLALKSGAQPPSEAILRNTLGIAPGEPVPPGSNPETLVPFVQQTLARNRQQLLATMIQMGLQRIVIESGRLNAAMNFHIDATSAAANDRGSQFDLHNTTDASVNAKFGPWGAEAKVQNTIGYVTTDRTQTTENMHTDVNLSSGVELVFRTDYVPLTRLAGVQDVERIRVNTINPDAEAARIAADRTARQTAESADEAARSGRLDAALRPPPAPPPPPPPAAAALPRPTTPAGTTPPAAGQAPASGSTPPAGRTPAPTGGTATPAGAGASRSVVAPSAAQPAQRPAQPTAPAATAQAPPAGSPPR
jgi:hypothetical protein